MDSAIHSATGAKWILGQITSYRFQTFFFSNFSSILIRFFVLFDVGWTFCISGKMASAVAPSFRSTKETTNYARLCRLLVDVSVHILRETFDKRRPTGDLNAVLSSPPVHAVLQSLRKKRILSPFLWRKLYPAIKSTASSKDFDIPLLMVLLRNICGLARPATGWDTLPPAADTTLEADIVRIKCYRNTVYGHASEASVDDPTFNQYWQDIQDALVRLGGAGYQSVIDDLKKECMDPVFEEHYIELLKHGWSQHQRKIGWNDRALW